MKGVPLWRDSRVRREGAEKNSGWRNVKERTPHPSPLSGSREGTLALNGSERPDSINTMRNIPE